MQFRARTHTLTFPRPALIMGVLNVTPDSFYDGGNTFETKTAIARGIEMVSQGADILDIGGESSRPGATPVTEAEEIRRVIPVVEHLSSRVTTPISVDTTKPGVAYAAICAGASIVNDIGASQNNPEMWRVVAETQVGYICMHMKGTPKTMQINPSYEDAVSEIMTFFEHRKKVLHDSGVAMEQVAFDPGIGFGKSPEHNLQLLAALGEFQKLERPILIGVSRKSFIGKILKADLEERLPASLACAAIAVEAGVQFLRVHDVWETIQVVRMAEAILAQRA